MGVTSGQAGKIERPARAGDDRVTTIELFFDLVFVFTITQLTTLLVRYPSGDGVGQVAVLFGNLRWMYGGYAWLTNAVPPRRASQQVLLLSFGRELSALTELAAVAAILVGGIVVTTVAERRTRPEAPRVTARPGSIDTAP